MPPKKREDKFFNVGVQGRKTGVTLEDKGVRDEHGLEPLSGIFSSPEKSPPKRETRRATGGTVTTSESMDLDETEVPSATRTNPLLRSGRTNLPPPARARSPMKTSLGSSPRRSVGPKTHTREANTLVISRRLDFEQDESLVETPALSGSGQRRKEHRNIYSIEPSPSRAQSALLEESLQEEITQNEDSGLFNGYAEESFAGGVTEDSMGGAEITEDAVEVEESAVVEEEEPAPKPGKRGRKRKSDTLDANAEVASAAKARKRGSVPKRNQQVSDLSKPQGRATRSRQSLEEDLTPAADVSIDDSEQTEEVPTPAPAKKRGRHAAKAKADVQKAVPAKEKEKDKHNAVFKKPMPPAKPKGKMNSKSVDESGEAPVLPNGKLVDTLGNPLSKDEIDQMSVTSTASRFGRGRSLSVFRQIELDEASRGRTGRHRVAPLNFWKNERAVYDKDGDIQAVIKPEFEEPGPKKHSTKAKGRKRPLKAIEEDEEDDLEEWEREMGVIAGPFKTYDAETNVTGDDEVEEPLAWADKGINPADVPDTQFRFTKLFTTPRNFFSCGVIDLPIAGTKRPKNARRMHMCFHVTRGAVRVTVAENEFVVHKGGVWQVPRGRFDTAFFAGAFALVRGKSRYTYPPAEDWREVVPLGLGEARWAAQHVQHVAGASGCILCMLCNMCRPLSPATTFLVVRVPQRTDGPKVCFFAAPRSHCVSSRLRPPADLPFADPAYFSLWPHFPHAPIVRNCTSRATCCTCASLAFQVLFLWDAR
ncbi:hypothetical protein EJ04DRAFT_551053 [Polyplosphaeria fusca]|uniref:Cupin domain-containing protein n=1 Tax=Polyplosphaeria fusca TaxID=682080 RepID=A0A9P4V4Y8_9PLEO|nr:hypothetical protein EJ04DRAFT_551053 [Polyplosphaeria fusca]